MKNKTPEREFINKKYQHLTKEGKDYVMDITLEDMELWLKEYADQFRGNKIKIVKPTKEICIHEWIEVSSGNFIQCKKCFIYGP